MNKHDIFNRLQNIFTDKMLNKLKESIVYIEPNGDVVLFDTYTIKNSVDGFLVVKYNMEAVTMSSLPIAVAWCTFDKRNMINQVLDIERLDQRLNDASVNYEVHKRLVERSKNMEDRALYRIKMQEDNEKRRKTKEYLNTYISQAKKHQEKIFESLA